MAHCDEGYRCEVCGEDVAEMTDSDLYLRYILGEVPIYRLHQLPERHIRCNPALAQFIADPAFPPQLCDGPFDRRTLDPSFVATEESRVTRAWRRLQILPGMALALDQYPVAADAQ